MMPAVNLNYGKLKNSYLFANIAERVNAYSALHPEQHLLRLGIGDVTQPLTPSVIAALHEAVDMQSRSDTFHGYMSECGYAPLRSAIAGYYRQRNVILKDSEVFVSSGASDELGDILHLFERSLEVILMEPAYPAYADANVMDGRMIHYMDASDANGFTPPPPQESFQALIYICSPNNPTGAVFTRDLLKQWVDYANQTGSVILFDAAYEAFISEADIPRSIYEIEGAKTCAIEISSLSKTAGFTGTRCGYTVIPEELVRDDMNLNAMWVRNRTTRTNGVSFIVQHGALAVFSDRGQKEVQELLSVYRMNAKNFMKALDEAGLKYFGGRNSPYIWIKCPDGMSGWETFDRLLEQAQIIGTPGEGFGKCGAGWFRFSMFADQKDIEKAGSRIGAVLK